MTRYNCVSDETTQEVKNEISDFLNRRKSDYIKNNSLFLYNKYLNYTGRDFSEYTLASLRTNLYDAAKAYSKHLSGPIGEEEEDTLLKVYERSVLDNNYKIRALPANLVIKDPAAKPNTMLNKVLAAIPQTDITFLFA